MLENEDDRATFLEDFGMAVTWEGAAKTFLGIFERPTRMVDGMAEAPLIDREASLLCREADLPAGAGEGDAVSIDGESQSYACRALRPDGSGFVVVDMKRASAFIGLDFSSAANSQYVPLI